MIRAICDAASEGKVHDVKKLLRADPLLATARDEDGWTPCLRAAFFNQHATAAVLLRGGAPPNDTDFDTYGFSALHWAAERNNVHLIMSLAARPGVNMNIRDRCGYTPLHRAAIWNNFSAVVALVVSGADPRLTTERGETAERLAEESPAIRCVLRAALRLVWSCMCPPEASPSESCFGKSVAMKSLAARSPTMSASTSSSSIGSDEDDDHNRDLEEEEEEEEEELGSSSSYQRLINVPGSSSSAGRPSVASMFVCREGKQQQQHQQQQQGVGDHRLPRQVL